MLFDKEQNYIRYRTCKAFCGSICFYICRLFPIDKKLISVCTFEGKGGFGCNPKYIVQELHRRDPSLKFVWFVNDMAKEFPPYIRKVPNTLWSRAFWLSRSKVWIDNYRKPYGTRKRRGQFYVNTWHGELGFKTIGLWRGKAFSQIARFVSENDSRMIDIVPIESIWGRNVYPKGLLYKGSFLMSGSPRCDIIFGDRSQVRTAFRERHGLAPDSKVVMFAPTYRETSRNGRRSVMSKLWSLDFGRLLRNLSAKFGGEWKLCMRLHPQLAADMDFSTTVAGIKILDVSRDDDMYEDLAAMDAFVTDFSSAAFDASLCRIPVFIYADDLDSYKDDRGELEWELSSSHTEEVWNKADVTPGFRTVLPYSVAQDNDGLEQAIAGFDTSLYEEKLQRFESDIELLFDGKGSARVADVIEQTIGANA